MLPDLSPVIFPLSTSSLIYFIHCYFKVKKVRNFFLVMVNRLQYHWKILGLAAIGALLAAPSSDHFGRKKVIIFSSLVFTIGGIVCAVSPEKITLFFGRMLLGLAIGKMLIFLL